MSIAVGTTQRRIAWPLPAWLKMTGTNRECRKQWLRSVEEKELVSSASIFKSFEPMRFLSESMRVFVIFFVVALANINVWVVFRGNGHKPRCRTRSFIGCEVQYNTILLAQILLFNIFSQNCDRHFKRCRIFFNSAWRHCRIPQSPLHKNDVVQPTYVSIGLRWVIDGYGGFENCNKFVNG